VCVVSLALKMWTGPESVMYVLECLGVVDKIDTQLHILRIFVERAILAFIYAIIAGLVVVFFVTVSYFTLLILKLYECVDVYLSRCVDFWQYQPHTFPRPHPSYVGAVELLLNKAEDIMASSVKDIPNVYLCPIGLTVMRIPVITHTGKTYELENIEQWLQNNRHKCPETRQETKVVARNFALEELIEKWAHDVIANSEKNLPPPEPEEDSLSIAPEPVQKSMSISPAAPEEYWVSYLDNEDNDWNPHDA
jgi:hypothetical protein